VLSGAVRAAAARGAAKARAALPAAVLAPHLEGRVALAAQNW